MFSLQKKDESINYNMSVNGFIFFFFLFLDFHKTEVSPEVGIENIATRSAIFELNPVYDFVS